MIYGIFFFVISLLLPFSVFAQESLDPCQGDNATTLSMCKSAALPIGGTIGTVIQFLFIIATILALGFLVYGGIKWITSGGDKGGVESARNMIIAAVIGMIVVFISYVILNVVLIFLTGEGIGGIKIPVLGQGGINLPNCYGPGGEIVTPNPDPGVNCRE